MARHTRRYTTNNCATCHSKLYSGGTSGVSCFTCHASYPHKAGWTDSSRVTFHGEYLQSANWALTGCASCHGGTLTGGTSGKSCFTCHSQYPHPAGWITRTSANFHGEFMRSASWDMRTCQTCHGTTYAGGRTSVSCRTCHTEAAGPENCTTCHGSTNNAPPRDLSKNTARGARGVGTHQSHVLGNTIAGAVTCTECHVVPGQVYAVGHIGPDNRAEVLFNYPVTNTRTNRPGTIDYDPTLPLFTPTPSYDQSTLRCSNTYCHGYFKNGNTTFAPTWNDTTSASGACGTCHGNISAPLDTLGTRYLPKTTTQGGTHPAVAGLGIRCNVCHAEVVDANFRIINTAKHINGKLNVLGTEREW